MKDHLSLRKLITLGGALFSVHFGASCLLYPVTWGKESGSQVFTAYLGVLISGIILPLLAYVAMVRGKGSFREITDRFLPRLGRYFCFGTVVLLGPLFVIPRMSAAAWDAIRQLTGWHSGSRLPAILFNLVYYVSILFIAARKGKTMERIGRFIFPVIIAIIAGVIIKGLLSPLGAAWTDPGYAEPPFIYGFREGYSTTDLLCSLLFGMLVVTGLRNANVPAARMDIELIKVCGIGLGLLGLTHLGHMIVGANTCGTLHLVYAQLYAEVACSLFGHWGGVLFCIGLFTVAITSAVGLTASTAEYLEKAVPGLIDYNRATVITCTLSCLISGLGLASIVQMITPLLDIFYPGAIVMVLYYALIPNSSHKSRLFALSVAFGCALLSGAADAAASYLSLLGVDCPAFTLIYARLPLSALKLGWVPLSFIGYLTGLLIDRFRSGNQAAASQVNEMTAAKE